ncbi:hypothetical protein BS50DRAFT_335124 [Corynespora cassiicola Philippines]|uniref:Uncharacterized protein n=1 Tax=Corynespora cassiicola Philippines TaxID=1448308 RepID=A0A2T2NUW6_CORCC|nr:hypothetical protein BS50DRAFT_335124 [Corynespora cassiicola Philippines]
MEIIIQIYRKLCRELTEAYARQRGPGDLGVGVSGPASESRDHYSMLIGENFLLPRFFESFFALPESSFQESLLDYLPNTRRTPTRRDSKTAKLVYLGIKSVISQLETKYFESVLVGRTKPDQQMSQWFCASMDLGSCTIFAPLFQKPLVQSKRE